MSHRAAGIQHCFFSFSIGSSPLAGSSSRWAGWVVLLWQYAGGHSGVQGWHSGSPGLARGCWVCEATVSKCSVAVWALPAAGAIPAALQEDRGESVPEPPRRGVLCEHRMYRWFLLSSMQNYSSSPVNLTHVLAGVGKCRKEGCLSKIA